MKGLELPINIIIIIAVAVLVLVVIAAFFLTNVGGSTQSMQIEQAFISGCTNLRALYQCHAESVNNLKISNFHPSGDPKEKCNLAYVCKNKGLSTVSECAKQCGCSYESSNEPLTPKCEKSII